MRDPRFDHLCGNFNKDLFDKSYSFLKEHWEHEKQLIQETLSTTTEEHQRCELQSLLNRKVYIYIYNDRKLTK
jgi:hypothetical protein